MCKHFHCVPTEFAHFMVIFFVSIFIHSLIICIQISWKRREKVTTHFHVNSFWSFCLFVCLFVCGTFTQWDALASSMSPHGETRNGRC